jgi:diguanylate cyclase (GGDEF)-like protein
MSMFMEFCSPKLEEDLQMNTDLGLNLGVENEMKHIEERDWALWCIGIAVLVVVAAGFLALIVPNLVWKGSELRVDGRFLPQLLTGFMVLIALFGAYLFEQKRRLGVTREQLMRKLVAQITASEDAVDPTTRTCSLGYLQYLLPKEIARAERSGIPFSLASVSAVGLAAINKKFGSIAGDHVMLILARLLRDTFRGADVICRGGSGEFVILMPDTTEALGQRPLERLAVSLAKWNEATTNEYTISIDSAVVGYSKGLDVWARLQELRSAHGARPVPINIFAGRVHSPMTPGAVAHM